MLMPARHRHRTPSEQKNGLLAALSEPAAWNFRGSSESNGHLTEKENAMKKRVSLSRWLIAILAAAIGFQAPQVRAEIVGTDEMTVQNQSEAERAKVRSFVERANVKERLQAMGVDGVLAGDRVAAMNEAEVHALAQRIDTMPAGGNLSNMDLILILLIAILVAIAI